MARSGRECPGLCPTKMIVSDSDELEVSPVVLAPEPTVCSDVFGRRRDSLDAISAMSRRSSAGLWDRLGFREHRSERNVKNAVQRVIRSRIGRRCCGTTLQM